MAVELRASMGKMTGDAQTDMKTMYNYVMLLTEELRYAMNNIGISNLNDKELMRYENGRLQIYSQEVRVQTDKLRLELGSELEQVSSSIEAQAGRIDAIVEGIGSDGTVNAASIMMAINGDNSEIRISADKIKLEGDASFVTTDQLRDGETVISGDNIRTGEIRAVNFVAIGNPDDDEMATVFAIEDTSERRVGVIGYQYDQNEGAAFGQKVWIRAPYIGNYEYPSIKLEAAGNVSISAGSNSTGIPGLIYMKADSYISLDGGDVFIYDDSGTTWKFSGGSLYKNGVAVL